MNNNLQLLIILLLAVIFGGLVEGFSSSSAPVPDNANFSKKLGTMKTMGLEMGKNTKVDPFCYDASCADNS